MGPDSLGDLVAALDRWGGSWISVRVVAGGDDLVVVAEGRLGRVSHDRPPALFWPLDSVGREGAAEQPGIYVHPAILADVRVHAGAFVVEYSQDGVEVNLRRLDVAQAPARDTPTG